MTTSSQSLPHTPLPPAATTSMFRAWSVTAVAVACGVVVFLDKAMIGLVAQPLRTDLGLSAGQFGAISSASYVLYVVTCIVVGFVAIRVSPRWVLLVCALLWAVGQVPGFLAASGAALFASRLAVGAAEGPAGPMSLTTAYSWFPNDRRALPTALITSGAAVAKIALAPALTAVIVVFGWRSGFATVAALAIAWSLAWLALGRLGPYAAPAPGSTDRPAAVAATAETDVAALPWRRVIGNGTFLGSFAACFAQGALAAVIYTWLPSYFQHGLGMSEGVAGSLFGLPSAAAIVALLLVGLVSDRLLRRRVRSRYARGYFGGACLVLSGLVLTILPWIHHAALAIAVLMLGYGGSVTVNAFANPAVAEIVPARQRSAALGLLAGLGASAGIVSPYLTGVLLDHAGSPIAGYTAAFLIFGILVAVGGLCFGLLVNPERDGKPRPRLSQETV